MQNRGAERAVRAGWASAWALALAGCAQIGPVRPPSAQIPRPPADFQAVRSGAEVLLHWTVPRQTSDGVALRSPVAYLLCAWPGRVPGTPPAKATPLPTQPQAVTPQVPSPPPSAHSTQATPSGAAMPPCPQLLTLTGHRVALAQLPHGAWVTLALRVMNDQRQSAGWSNPVPVPTTPVAPPPQLTSVRQTPPGVALAWMLPVARQALNGIAIFRNGVKIATAPAGATSYVDATTAANQHYVYWLRSRNGTGAQAVTSANSNQIGVETNRVFPPPPPTGLQAVVSPAGVDLSWNTVAAPDLAGYNLYRRPAAGGPWQRRNPELLPTPVFHDAPLPPGTSWLYAVTAVNARQAESPRSMAVRVSAGVGANATAMVTLQR